MLKNAIKVILTTIVISLFFILAPLTVSASTPAKLELGTISLNCVYNSGIQLDISYYNGKYQITAKNIGLYPKVAMPYDSNKYYFIDKDVIAEKALKNVACPDYIYYFVLNQTAENDSSVDLQMISSQSWCVNSDVKEHFKDKFTSLVPNWGFPIHYDLSDSGYCTCSNCTESTTQYFEYKYNLTYEKIKFITYVDPGDNAWAFKSLAPQASSSPSYVRIYKYSTLNNEYIHIAEKDGNLNRIEQFAGAGFRDRLFSENIDNKVAGICFAPAIKISSMSEEDTGFSYSRIRNGAYSYTSLFNNESIINGTTTNINNCNNSGGVFYSQVAMAPGTGPKISGTSICDVIPETAVIIAKIIKYASILVPIILIVLTSIDISKIVIAGNLEEELPKKKKIIIIRIVVAIVFFLLPPMVSEIISNEYGIDFGDISCLYD